MSFIIDTTITASQSLASLTGVGVVTSYGALIVQGVAVTVTTDGGFIVNDGLINALSFAVNATADFSLMNRGLMTTESFVININTTGSTITDTAITNSGDIVSTRSNAITCADAGLTIQNAGLISGRTTTISLSATDQSAISKINNTGTIESAPTSGTGTAILCNGTMQLTNTGLILGRINLGDGDDLVDTRAGTVLGDIDLDDGNNLFLGGSLGETVVAGVGQDTLRGEGGDDVLTASLGNDILRGGSGDDTLTGGGDADILSGGLGRDVFVFQTSGDSDLTQTADQIRDFRHGDDLIDLSAFAPTVFTFVGAQPFKGAGTASFGFTKTAGVVTLVADLNGDGNADFHVEVLGPKSLQLSDFVL